MTDDSTKVGVAVAVHNNWRQTEVCLSRVLQTREVEVYPVVLDDGSTDSTWEMLRKNFPIVKAIKGSGTLWWTGGTNEAIRVCLNANCEYVLLLNPDVIVEHDTIGRLLSLVTANSKTIAAAAVVRDDFPEYIWWAGSQWRPLISWLPFIWVSRYLFKAGTPVANLPEQPFLTSEAHGRAVLVPAKVFEEIGLYDYEHLPHYGADTDFSFRAGRAGYQILVDPRTRVQLHVENTGLKAPSSFKDSWHGYWNYLTKRKNGEALRVWWYITQRHLSWYSAIPTYLAILGWNSFRYWSSVFRRSTSN